MRSVMKLALAPLLAVAAGAMAQPAERFQDAHGCDRANASRLPPKEGCGGDDDQPLILRHEDGATLRFEAPVLQSRQCQVRVAIEYLQLNIHARVGGTIENEDCAASSGSYTIALTIRGAEGDYERLEFPRTWRRDDDQPLNFSADYPIGENVELVRARVLRPRCRCEAGPGSHGALPQED